MIDQETVAHELALEYIRKTNAVPKNATPQTVAEVYLSALDKIREELDRAKEQKR